jgi:hypothetical protein
MMLIFPQKMLMPQGQGSLFVGEACPGDRSPLKNRPGKRLFSLCESVA